MASPFLLAANDGTDIGYNKAIVDALMVVAQGGDRRGFTYQKPTGSYSYLGVNRVQYPRTYLNTDTVPALTGIVRSPAATDVGLAAALAAAAPGDWVVQQVATYTATYNAPAKAGDALPGGTNVVTVIAKHVYDSIVAGEPTVLPRLKRIADADKAAMPYFKNVSLANAEQWTFDGANSGWRFIGIRFGADATVTALSRLVRVGNGDGTLQSNPALTPQNVTFDRCHFDGHATLNLKCALELHGRALTVTECYFGDNIHHNGQDCQAIRAYNGKGPFRIVNSRLVGSTENVIFGGSYSTPGNAPQDLEFRWNYLVKPLTWNTQHPSYAGVQWSVKNLFEVKKLQWGLVEGNYLDRTWGPAGGGSQAGAALLIKSESYGDGAVNGYTHDVLVRWNLVEDAAFGINIAGVNNTDPAFPPANIFSVGNLYKIGAQYFDASQNPMFGIGSLTNCGTIHDTFIALGIVLDIGAPGGGQTGLVMLDSIFGHTTYGLKGPGTTEGTATLVSFAPNADVRKCVFVGRSSGLYPTGNFFPADETAVGFTNYAGGDYSLNATSQVIVPPPVIVDRVATTFENTTAPAGSNSGAALTTQPRFRVLDQYGAVFQPGPVTVAVTIVGGTGTITAGNSFALSNGAGGPTNLTLVAPFTNDVTLRFTPSNGLAAIDLVITTVVTPVLAIVTNPGGAVSGAHLAPQPEVRFVDAIGNALALAGRTITATILNGAGAIVGGATKVTDVNGHALFTELAASVTATSADLTFRFASPGATPVDAPPVTITNPIPGGGDTGVATHFVCTRNPEGPRNGRPLRVEPRFEWRDAFEHLVTTETSPISLRVIGNARTIGTNTLPAIGGVVDFAGSGFGIDGRGHVTLIAEGTP